MSIFDRLFKKKDRDIDRGNLPSHIAIIMDGNGRWAKKRGLSRSIGHREGSNTLRRITEFCNEIGIKYLTVYAFSTENWKRPKKEVDGLMSLLLEYLKKAERELVGKDTRIRVIGSPKGLSQEIREQVIKVENLTRNNKGLCLCIALNYGGREEIINAVTTIAKEVKEGKLEENQINQHTFSTRLYTVDIPDPDLLIRPSGEQRLSNFLLWQSAYTEFWYTNILWPDFKEQHLMQAISEYQSRNRRFGGV